MLARLSTVLRELPQPVIGRIESDQLLLDLRCLDEATPLLALLPLLQERIAA